MLSRSERTLIFLGDLLPIFLIGILLSLHPFSWYPIIGFLVLLTISVSGTFYLFEAIKNSQNFNRDPNYGEGGERKIIKIEDKGSIYTIYMVTFVSLIPLFYNSIYGFISFGIVILIVYSLYMNSDMLFYNPILALSGYKFYKFDLSDGHEVYAISKDQINIGEDREKLNFYTLTDYVYVVVKRE